MSIQQDGARRDGGAGASASRARPRHSWPAFAAGLVAVTLLWQGGEWVHDQIAGPPQVERRSYSVRTEQTTPAGQAWRVDTARQATLVVERRLWTTQSVTLEVPVTATAAGARLPERAEFWAALGVDGGARWMCAPKKPHAGSVQYPERVVLLDCGYGDVPDGIREVVAPSTL